MGKILEIKGLISFGRAAKQLGISRALLTYLKKQGKIDYYQIGDSYYLDEEGLEKLRRLYEETKKHKGPRAKHRF